MNVHRCLRQNVQSLISGRACDSITTTLCAVDLLGRMASLLVMLAPREARAGLARVCMQWLLTCELALVGLQQGSIWEGSLSRHYAVVLLLLCPLHHSHPRARPGTHLHMHVCAWAVDPSVAVCTRCVASQTVGSSV